jgi:hypothetical protein
MMARSFILMAIAAIQLPCRALAQDHGFIGMNGGASHVSTDGYGVRADNRASFGARAGYGWSRVKIVLDYQRHGLGDEQPLPSDWAPGSGEQVRIPQVMETDFLLLGAQIRLNRGLYLRPALGVGWRAGVHYGLPNPEVIKDPGPAAGASVGYQFKIHPRFSLGIEASGSVTSSLEGEDASTVFGIQLVPLLNF